MAPHRYSSSPDIENGFDRHELLKSETSTDTGELCPPERALTLPDGSKKCANCADCPRKLSTSTDDGSPKIRIQMEPEIDFTSSFSTVHAI